MLRILGLKNLHRLVRFGHRRLASHVTEEEMTTQLVNQLSSLPKERQKEIFKPLEDYLTAMTTSPSVDFAQFFESMDENVNASGGSAVLGRHKLEVWSQWINNCRPEQDFPKVEDVEAETWRRIGEAIGVHDYPPKFEHGFVLADNLSTLARNVSPLPTPGCLECEIDANKYCESVSDADNHHDVTFATVPLGFETEGFTVAKAAKFLEGDIVQDNLSNSAQVAEDFEATFAGVPVEYEADNPSVEEREFQDSGKKRMKLSREMYYIVRANQSTSSGFPGATYAVVDADYEAPSTEAWAKIEDAPSEFMASGYLDDFSFSSATPSLCGVVQTASYGPQDVVAETETPFSAASVEPGPATFVLTDVEASPDAAAGASAEFSGPFAVLEETSFVEPALMETTSVNVSSNNPADSGATAEGGSSVSDKVDGKITADKKTEKLSREVDYDVSLMELVDDKTLEENDAILKKTDEMIPLKLSDEPVEEMDIDPGKETFKAEATPSATIAAVAESAAQAAVVAESAATAAAATVAGPAGVSTLSAAASAAKTVAATAAKKSAEMAAALVTGPLKETVKGFEAWKDSLRKDHVDTSTQASEFVTVKDAVRGIEEKKTTPPKAASPPEPVTPIAAEMLDMPPRVLKIVEEFEGLNAQAMEETAEVIEERIDSLDAEYVLFGVRSKSKKSPPSTGSSGTTGTPGTAGATATTGDNNPSPKLPSDMKTNENESNSVATGSDSSVVEHGLFSLAASYVEPADFNLEIDVVVQEEMLQWQQEVNAAVVGGTNANAASVEDVEVVGAVSVDDVKMGEDAINVTGDYNFDAAASVTGDIACDVDVAAGVVADDAVAAFSLAAVDVDPRNHPAFDVFAREDASKVVESKVETASLETVASIDGINMIAVEVEPSCIPESDGVMMEDDVAAEEGARGVPEVRQVSWKVPERETNVRVTSAKIEGNAIASMLANAIETKRSAQKTSPKSGAVKRVASGEWDSNRLKEDADAAVAFNYNLNAVVASVAMSEPVRAANESANSFFDKSNDVVFTWESTNFSDALPHEEASSEFDTSRLSSWSKKAPLAAPAFGEGPAWMQKAEVGAWPSAINEWETWEGEKDIDELKGAENLKRFVSKSTDQTYLLDEFMTLEKLEMEHGDAMEQVPNEFIVGSSNIPRPKGIGKANKRNSEETETSWNSDQMAKLMESDTDVPGIRTAQAGNISANRSEQDDDADADVKVNVNANYSPEDFQSMRHLMNLEDEDNHWSRNLEKAQEEAMKSMMGDNGSVDKSHSNESADEHDMMKADLHARFHAASVDKADAGKLDEVIQMLASLQERQTQLQRQQGSREKDGASLFQLMLQREERLDRGSTEEEGKENSILSSRILQNESKSSNASPTEMTENAEAELSLCQRHGKSLEEESTSSLLQNWVKSKLLKLSSTNYSAVPTDGSEASNESFFTHLDRKYKVCEKHQELIDTDDNNTTGLLYQWLTVPRNVSNSSSQKELKVCEKHRSLLDSDDSHTKLLLDRYLDEVAEKFSLSSSNISQEVSEAKKSRIEIPSMVPLARGSRAAAFSPPASEAFATEEQSPAQPKLTPVEWQSMLEKFKSPRARNAEATRKPTREPRTALERDLHRMMEAAEVNNNSAVAAAVAATTAV